MAKFILLTNERNTYNDIPLVEGLNCDTRRATSEFGNGGGIAFTDTNWLNLYLRHPITEEYMPWVYDVTLPENERFISHGTFYKAQRIILSNRRRIWKESTDASLIPDTRDYELSDYDNSNINTIYQKTIEKYSENIKKFTELLNDEFKDIFINSANVTCEYDMQLAKYGLTKVVNMMYVANNDGNHRLICDASTNDMNKMVHCYYPFSFTA
jgi:hypothetical protein